MLHSIFFLGYIYDSSLTPDMFFTKPTSCAFVKEKFPEPFEKYKTHLPTRTPFSILLNMVSQKYDDLPNKYHVSKEK